MAPTSPASLSFTSSSAHADSRSQSIGFNEDSARSRYFAILAIATESG